MKKIKRQFLQVELRDYKILFGTTGSKIEFDMSAQCDDSFRDIFTL